MYTVSFLNVFLQSENNFPTEKRIYLSQKGRKNWIQWSFVHLEVLQKENPVKNVLK